MHYFVTIGVSKLELQSGNAQSGSNSTILRAVWPCNLTYNLEKQQDISFILLQALCIISKPLVNWNWSYSPETANVGQNQRFFLAVWPCNLTYDLEKQQGTSSVITSSVVHHFVAISVLKLELESGNAQFESNLTIFRAVWPWNLTDDLEKQKGTSSKLLQALSYNPETRNLGQIRRFLEPCDLAIWPMTLKNNRQHQAICFISSSYVNSNLSYSPEKVKFCCDLCDLDLWSMTLGGIYEQMLNCTHRFRIDSYHFILLSAMSPFSALTTYNKWADNLWCSQLW